MSKRKIHRIVEAGKALYGERWQTRFAAVSPISQTHLNNVIRGLRELTPEVERQIAETFAAEAARLKKNAATVERIATAMLADLEKSK